MHEPQREPSPAGEDQKADASSALDEAVVELLQLAGNERAARLAQIAAAEPELAEAARRRLGVLDDHGLLGQAASADPPAPQQIGGYRILRRLGSGGMGVVWLAEQPSLRRTVALKVLHEARLYSERARERFRREAMAAARLDHPGLCAVYEVGETDGVPFLAMRYVPGRTLAELVQDARARRQAPVALDTQSAEARTSGSGERRYAALAVVEIVERVARAIHCAHQAGLVHRDLKPENIVVDPDGAPVVLDFGLVQDDSSEGDPTLTLSGDRVGTPAYMAPEQVTGGRPDARTDVYALGALLYECLTLALPVDGADRGSLYRSIVRGGAAEAARRAAGLEHDLRVILAAAMAPEPERRYPSALALAEDLARYHAHEPILARAAGPWLRARRWTQRNPVAAILLAALALGLVVTGTLLNQIQRSLRRAGSLALAGLAHEVGETDPQAGLAIARKAHARDPSPATLSAVYRALAAAHEERSFRGHDAAVWRTVFSADGHHLASCSDDCTAIVWDTRGEAEPKVLRHGAQVMDIDTDGRRLVTASQDGTVRLFDFDGVAIDRAPLPSRQGGAGHYLRARFAHDAQKVVICSFDGAAWIWDLGQHSLVELVGHRGMVWCGSFSPDDRLVLTAVGYGSEMVQYADDHSARVWDLEGKCLATMNGHEQSLLCAEFSPDCSLVLTGSHDRTLRLWRATGEHLRTFRGHGAAVRCVRFLPGGEHFVSADLDGNVRLWRLDSAEVVATFAHDAAVWSLELSSDGQRILTASWDQTARVHDLRGRLLRTLRGHGSKVKHATWSPDGERIATASYDYTVRLWRASEQDFATHVGHGDGVRSIAVRPDGEGFATGSLDRTVRVWSEEQVRVLATPSPVNRVAYSPSGASLVSVHDDQSGALWSGSGEATARFAGSTRTAFAGVPAWRNASAAFLDGERFLIGSQDASMRLFDAGGTCLRELDAEEVFAQRTGELFDLAAHPGGNHFAAGYWRGDVLVRDLGGGVVARGAPAHSGWVMRVEFSRDGQWLVSASADRTAVLWRWTGGRLERHRTMPHEAAVTWAGFSPDGGRILTTARDGTARLWPLDGGEPLVIRAAADPLWCGAWTHDGRHVLTGAASGLVRRWLVDETRVLELAKERDTRELRPEEQARVESVTR